MTASAQSKIETLARKLLVVGDESRLAILCLIFDKKKVCVSAIAEELGMSVATVSHHLHTLAEEGLLEPNREGKRVCYMLVRSTFSADLKNFICRNRK